MTQSISDVNEIGVSQVLAQRLVQARMERAWTIDEVAGHLKVRSEVIARFESEQVDFSQLTSFERGYLRNYAELLELPFAEFEALFPDVAEMSSPLAIVRDRSLDRKPLMSGARFKWLLALATLLLILVLITANI